MFLFFFLGFAELLFDVHHSMLLVLGLFITGSEIRTSFMPYVVFIDGRSVEIMRNVHKMLAYRARQTM